MSKFHINKHGVPVPCKATKGNCPLGGDSGNEGHFDNVEDAQEYADKINEEKHNLLPASEPANPTHYVDHSEHIPEFYKDDAVLERFYDDYAENGDQGYYYAGLDDEDKYDIMVDDYDANDYLDAYNDSYSEKSFDYDSDKMAEHYVSKGIFKDKEGFNKRVSEIGKDKAFYEFNEFVFNGTKPGSKK